MKGLPIFPIFYDKPSEDRLERTIERLVNFADEALLNGSASQEDYDAWSTALDVWARKYQ